MISTNVEPAVDGTGPAIRIDGGLPLSVDTVSALNALCDAAEDSPGGLIRLIVSGAPSTARRDDAGIALVSKWEQALRRLERLSVATVALAVGDCGGIALDTLLATDHRIATHDSRLLVPVRDGSTWPGMAVYRLTQQVGVARVRRTVLFGRPIEAPEALRIGLLDELVDDLDAGLAAIPRGLAGFPGIELAIRRRLMLDATTVSFENALGTHLAACDRVLRHAAGVTP